MKQRLVYAFLFFSLSPFGTAAAGEVFPMEAQELAPGIYAVVTPSRELPNRENRGWNSNSAFIVTGAGTLLFDTGSSQEIGEALRATIADVTHQPVRWIVNSHAHGDHWLGNAAFEASVEQIIASTKTTQAIEISGVTWIDLFKRMTEGITGESKILAPTRRVDERTETRFGDVEAVLFPSGDSHSPGDLLLWLPQQRVLFSGDVVYSDRMPSTNDSRIDQWIRKLDQLVALEPKMVVAGHGVVTDIEGLMRLRDLLKALREAVAAGIDDGKSDYEMLPDVLNALVRFKPHYPGLEDKVRRDISHVYLQVEQAMFE